MSFLVYRLQSDITDIKIDVEKLKTQNQVQMNKHMDSMDKGIDGLDTRLNTLTIGFLSIVRIFVTGLWTAVSKLISLPNF